MQIEHSFINGVPTGYAVKIEADDSPDAPDAYGDDAVFLSELESRRYCIGRKGWGKSDAEPFIPYGEGPWDYENTDYYDLAEQVGSEQELREAYEGRCRPTPYEVYPVRLAVCGSNGAQIYECEYDKAEGYIFVKLPYRSEIERLAHIDFDADKLAKNLLKEWNTYLSGEVYRVTLYDSSNDIVESACSIYGYKEAEEVAQDLYQSYQEDKRKVKVIVTYGTLPLPFPSRCVSDVTELDVPSYVGDDHVPAYLKAKVFGNQHDILNISVMS